MMSGAVDALVQVTIPDSFTGVVPSPDTICASQSWVFVFCAVQAPPSLLAQAHAGAVPAPHRSESRRLVVPLDAATHAEMTNAVELGTVTV
jgi:hypothetical protein